jgi:hypothetical protein
MAGTIPLSLTQQLDEFGQPLIGGQLYIIQAGTVSTPQNAFQDTALTNPLPNPITLDALGRIPQFFLADGQIKVRLQDQFGVVKFSADNILVIGPSGGSGGGGGTVDPTTVMQTGDFKLRYDVAIISGFVRLNGKTIGSAASGATELADPSAQALFNYLWVKDTTLVVTPGGRGASAAADWAANKQLTLPDGRNRLLMALADMGNSDVGLLASNTFTKGNQITLGSMLGVARRAIDSTMLPSHYHSAAIYDPTHTHTYGYTSWGNQAGNQAGYWGLSSNAFNATATTGGAATGVRVNSSNGIDTTYSAGGGGPFDIANPALLITVYMKL